jgi:biotin-dependent carboxylase-like uncharacterized protein
MIEVLDPGPLTTVQDLGRPGYAALGVPRAGALDAPALCLANRLVGNDRITHAAAHRGSRAAGGGSAGRGLASDGPGRAGLEVTVTGCRLRFTAPAVVAVTGAPAALTVDGRPAPFGAPVTIPAGGVLAVGPALAGVRSYIGVGGGIAVPPVLGSRSTDTLSGLGPAPLRAGDLLPVGPPPGDPAAMDWTPTRWPADRIVLRLRRGPRDDWFTDPEALLRNEFTISPTSNRVGVRLLGTVLVRARQGELDSEGMVLGAVQVPPNGLPVIFLADHPTTGGYPVIGVIHPDDLVLLAQARPGTSVAFRGSQR